jgi:hypothetical protein
VATGHADVVLPDGFRHQAGDQVTLTDAQYAQIGTAVTAGVVTDLGEVADGAVTVNGKTGSNITLTPADLGLPNIAVQASAPSSPATNDVWLDT